MHSEQTRNKAFLADQGWKYDAFICHTGRDKPFVRLLYDELLKRGLVAFYDERSLVGGDPVQQVIADAIELSPFFLVILSQSFTGRRYPEAEVEAALAFDRQFKRIIPVFYDMTADECCDCNISVICQLSAYTGWKHDKGSKSDEQLASDIADKVKKIAERQLSSNDLKVSSASATVKSCEGSDLEPLWSLRDKHLKRTEKPRRDIIFPNAFENRKFQYLYGRDDQIEELGRRFWGQEARQRKTRIIDHCIIQVVIGMGGAGKTTLAVAYARRYEADYSGGVYHFIAQSTSSFHQSIGINIARLTEGKYEHGGLEEDYQRFLSLLEKRGNTLLVFDGCDKLGVIDNLLPQHSATVHVIVTSRRSKVSRLFDDRTVNIVHLGRLQDDDAIRATLTWAGRSDDLSILDEGERSSASAVVKASGIQALPLALRHVGTRMKEEGMNFIQYHKLVKKKKRTPSLDVEGMDDCLRYYGLQRIRTALSKEGGIDEVTDMMSADLTQLRQSSDLKPWEVERLERLQGRLKSSQFIPWDMDIEEVTETSLLARKVLDMASLMHCELIPKEVLKQATFTDATDSEEDERQLSKALSLLSGFSLVEHPCNMHNLVQQSVVQAMMRDGSLSDRLRSLSECLTALLPQTGDGIRRNLNNSTVLKLALHVYSVASHILNSEDLQEECWSMLRIACRLAIESHHLEEAEDLCERRLGYVNNNSDHQEYTTMLLRALVDLGHVRIQMRKPQLAMEPLKKAFDLCTLTYGNRYPEAYAEVLDRLANCYMDLRHFEDAERLFLEELSFKERHQFSQASISAVINNLAVTYHLWGKVMLAIEKYEDSLAVNRRDCECNQIGLSTILMNLANCYEQNGRLDRARVLLDEAVTIIKRELPPSHPQLARGLRHLSDVYRELGNVDTALRLARQSLDVASTSLPTSHPDLGKFMCSVAACHHYIGAMDEAIGYYEKAGEIFSRHLSTQKRSLSNVKHNLAMAHRDMEQREKALQLIKESLELKKQSLPERHLEIGKSLVVLGSILCENGNFRNAFEHLQSGLSILQETIPSSHYTAQGLYWLGQTAMELDQWAEAQQHVAECLRLRQAIYPSGHHSRISAERLLQEIRRKTVVF